MTNNETDLSKVDTATLEAEVAARKDAAKKEKKRLHRKRMESFTALLTERAYLDILVPEHDRSSCTDEDGEGWDDYKHCVTCRRCILLAAVKYGWDEEFSFTLDIHRNY